MRSANTCAPTALYTLRREGNDPRARSNWLDQWAQIALNCLFFTVFFLRIRFEFVFPVFYTKRRLQERCTRVVRTHTPARTLVRQGCHARRKSSRQARECLCVHIGIGAHLLVARIFRSFSRYVDTELRYWLYLLGRPTRISEVSNA